LPEFDAAAMELAVQLFRVPTPWRNNMRSLIPAALTVPGGNAARHRDLTLPSGTAKKIGDTQYTVRTNAVATLNMISAMPPWGAHDRSIVRETLR
jgi:hypothetical protein